ncbi:hypothetical protein H6G95_30535 [Nostoc linckia FACHB-391]|nr:hypothetical protein [Nostoc linckia FACHB-391]
MPKVTSEISLLDLLTLIVALSAYLATVRFLVLEKLSSSINEEKVKSQLDQVTTLDDQLTELWGKNPKLDLAPNFTDLGKNGFLIEPEALCNCYKDDGKSGPEFIRETIFSSPRQVSTLNKKKEKEFLFVLEEFCSKRAERKLSLAYVASADIFLILSGFLLGIHIFFDTPNFLYRASFSAFFVAVLCLAVLHLCEWKKTFMIACFVKNQLKHIANRITLPVLILIISLLGSVCLFIGSDILTLLSNINSCITSSSAP